jgi:hypothetical protein
VAQGREGGCGSLRESAPGHRTYPFRRSLQRAKDEAEGKRPEDDPQEVFLAKWIDGYVLDLTAPHLAAEYPVALKRIVSLEYRVPTHHIDRWPYSAFADALSTLTEQRFGAVRAQSEQHNRKAQQFKASLPKG